MHHSFFFMCSLSSNGSKKGTKKANVSYKIITQKVKQATIRKLENLFLSCSDTSVRQCFLELSMFTD